MTEPRIDYGRMLDVLAGEVELLAEAAHSASPDVIVTACPGFTLGEVVRHVAAVYRSALRWMTADESCSSPGEQDRAATDGRRRANDAPATATPNGTGWRPSATAAVALEERLVDDLRAGLAALRDTLDGHAPDDPCPSWYPAGQHYGFWARRMLHETTVHRCDAQAAARPEGELGCTGIDEDVAVDGIDEILQLWLRYRLDELNVRATRPATVELRTPRRRWVVTLRHDGTEVTGHDVTAAEKDKQEPFVEERDRTLAAGQTSAVTSAGGSVSADVPKPDEQHTDPTGAPPVGTSADTIVSDAIVSGGAEQLYLWLWGRLPTRRDVVRISEHSGSADAVAQLWALLRLATR